MRRFFAGRARGFSLFLAGLFTGAAVSGLAAQYPLERLEVFAQALSIIEARYVDARDTDQLLYDAIGGMTQRLDDHSVFMDPQQYKEVREETTGEYFGVGVAVQVQGGPIIVTNSIEGSPAAEAGILPGDEILAVDGLKVSEIGDAAALSRIRGKRGTLVILTLRRPGVDAPFDVAVRRDQVRTKSVSWRVLDGGLGYLAIKRFQRRTADEVKRGLAELEEEVGTVNGVVLDLRDNPGGYLSQAVQVADLWIAKGPIVKTLDRGDLARADPAHASGTDLDTPLVVLINGGSASAAEVVAGALQDWRRASLVGSQSYGKGSVQQFFDLVDGSALKLTTARYFTPKGGSIHGSGIHPDVVVDSGGGGESDHSLEELLADAEDLPSWVKDDRTLHVGVLSLRDPEAVQRWQEYAVGDLAPPSPADAAPTNAPAGE